MGGVTHGGLAGGSKMAKIKSKSKLSKKIRNIKNVDPVVRTTSILMIYAKKLE